MREEGAVCKQDTGITGRERGGIRRIEKEVFAGKEPLTEKLLNLGDGVVRGVFIGNFILCPLCSAQPIFHLHFFSYFPLKFYAMCGKKRKEGVGVGASG